MNFNSELINNGPLLVYHGPSFFLVVGKEKLRKLKQWVCLKDTHDLHVET